MLFPWEKKKAAKTKATSRSGPGGTGKPYAGTKPKKKKYAKSFSGGRGGGSRAAASRRRTTTAGGGRKGK